MKKYTFLLLLAIFVLLGNYAECSPHKGSKPLLTSGDLTAVKSSKDKFEMYDGVADLLTENLVEPVTKVTDNSGTLVEPVDYGDVDFNFGKNDIIFPSFTGKQIATVALVAGGAVYGSCAAYKRYTTGGKLNGEQLKNDAACVVAGCTLARDYVVEKAFSLLESAHSGLVVGGGAAVEYAQNAYKNLCTLNFGSFNPAANR